ncbi:E3 ubiquitin-protein ligase RNF31 [Megalops cyprinoides]|uniref:E3 ubiquitin-protein ligase RNF31 n=1 Tax=Megalops cyprinoides TaxID=118141 RepID=UPI0018649892|nr:E3 ubiquitin-protein ligase RNF31 [Megalops cyprinoides]
MANLSSQLEELRGEAEAVLSSTGSAQEVKKDVLLMANIPLPLSAKYRHIAAENMVAENSMGSNRQETMACLQRLSTALNILEKYGCNLTSPNRPKYWRSVKHNNPVFRATVDAIRGGRAVLCLYGYSNQQPDGLSFPDDIMEPDVEKVAAVTLEVMTLRMELEMLSKETHPHPEFFERIIPSLNQQGAPPEQGEDGSVPDELLIPPTERRWQRDNQSPSLPPKPAHSPGLTPASLTPILQTGGCSLCGGAPSLLCPPCGSMPFCESCDLVFHRHPSRANHKRERTQAPENCTICCAFPVSAHCSTCGQWLCSECDRLYHSHPGQAGHSRTAVTSATPKRAVSASLSSWQCVHCTTVNEVQAVLCVSCDRPRLASTPSAGLEEPLQPSTITEWQCKSCTVVNAGSSVLCEVCERPRLATRPPPTPIRPSPHLPDLPKGTDTQWVCQFCTYVNSTLSSPVCEMCDLPRPDPAPLPHKPHPPSPLKDVPLPPVKPQTPPTEDPDLKRQKLMREEGLKLIQLIREGEKKGVSPEEVYTSVHVSGGNTVTPCDWLKSELPHHLDEICARAASVQQDYKMGHSGNSRGRAGEDRLGLAAQGGGVQVSRAEAKQAWLSAGGDTEKAVLQVLRDRRAKVRELASLGFSDLSRCEEALRLSGGEVRGALSLLQRPLLEPFHQRLWSDEPEPSIDTSHPDKQRVCRRLLAVYELPSWGRCELALSLLQDPGAPYTLEDVVQAVRESHDRDFIRRVLAKECPICLSVYPHNKMQSLTSCQCSVCCDCFQQHFTIAVRDKHIRDMVCPVCWEPDINDPEHLNSYFSTLDIQLRDCLDPEVYELFHKKLTEQALIKDPKFLWCSHCSYGFIYDGDQLKVTCFQCRNSFCAQCKKPWESQHAGLSCEQFQSWKRENDPEYQRQGLAGYLRDNGIICPNCRFQYALSKGGCMHFSCSQCRYQFCSGCNNPFHTTCTVAQCSVTGLHAHHPRDCLFYLRDWEPPRLQALLQKNGVAFNTDPPHGTQAGACGVMEQKDEGGRQVDSPCGAQTQPGQAGLCEKHYREYLVSLINGHSIDPAPLFTANEVTVACRRYQVDDRRGENEDDRAYYSRLLRKLIEEVPLGDKVPRKK